MLNRAKWSSIGVVSLSILALFVWVQPAEARGRGRGMGMGQGRGAGYGLAALNLTAAQQETIAALRADFVKQTAETQAKLDVKRAELRVLWTAAEPDGKAIKAKQAEMDVLRSQLRQAGVDHRLAVRAQLTPEQRLQFRACRGQAFGDGFGRHHRRGDRSGKGMGRGAGQGLGRGMGGGAGAY